MESPIAPALLAALAGELDRARSGVDGLAALVSGFVRACPPDQRAAVLADAQAVDALDQQLVALAAFVRDLAAGRPAAAAAAALPLGDLSDRLGAAAVEGACQIPSPTPGAACGELELFD